MPPVIVSGMASCLSANSNPCSHRLRRKTRWRFGVYCKDPEIDFQSDRSNDKEF